MRRILCGFPGVGKSFVSTHAGGYDSDSSRFSWKDGERNPDFPANYVEHIRGLDGIVLCSTHSEVRKALSAAGMPYELCYPSRACKEEYIGRYRSRGSSEGFIDIVSSMWDIWLGELENDSMATAHLVVAEGKYLSDYTDVLFKNGDKLGRQNDEHA